MERKGKNVLLMALVIFCLLMIIDTLPLGEDMFSQKACAVPREFEENITVHPNQIVPLELPFTQGDELELIYDMKVKEDLPVDIWFVDYANYVRLVDGHDFLFFIDGSGQELNKAQKVVTITLKGTYELVFANYNNVTVEVNLKYDINIYPEDEETSITGKIVDKEGGPIEGAIVQLRDSKGDIIATYTTNSTGGFEFINKPFGTYDILVSADGFKDVSKKSIQISSGASTADVGSIELKKSSGEETLLWESPISLLLEGLIIGIIAGLLGMQIVKGAGKKKPKAEAEAHSKKVKSRKKQPPKKKKVKKKEPVVDKKDTDAGTDEPIIEDESTSEKIEELKDLKKVPGPRFCGHCGKPVETPFCSFCGKEVTKG